MSFNSESPTLNSSCLDYLISMFEKTCTPDIQTDPISPDLNSGKFIFCPKHVHKKKHLAKITLSA